MKEKITLFFLFVICYTNIALANQDLSKYVSSLTFNDRKVVFTKEGNCFFVITPKQLDKDMKVTIGLETKNEGYKLLIGNTEIITSTDITFNKVNAGLRPRIQLLDSKGNLKFDGRLVFTSLPIVQLYTEYGDFSENFTKGKIIVNEAITETTGELINAEIRHRGATQLRAPKKSFSIKLKDENGKKIDKSFFGLRNDNFWILDGMYTDNSRLRDRGSVDLWMDFSTPPYYKEKEPKLINGYRGQYVEVFLDDKYLGLYCMLERVDRKQLKLKKYDNEAEITKGVLYKAKRWSTATYMGAIGEVFNEYNNEKTSWNSFEAKYPDLDDGQKIDWEPLTEVLNVASANQDIFETEVANSFDIPLWVDYYLLQELTFSTDNYGKNAYYYMYDITEERKISIAPWDMDAILGIHWSENRVPYDEDYHNSIGKRNNLFNRLKIGNVCGFNDLLKARYDQLRSTYFSTESLLNRFSNYYEMLEESGALEREGSSWRLNLKEEYDYLQSWIIGRVNYLNQKYGEPIITAEEEIDNFVRIYPNPVKDFLYLSNINRDTLIRIYTETGICVYQKEAKEGVVSIDLTSFDDGRYYVKVGNIGKVIIKKRR